MDCRTALQTILDQVNYTNGACRVNEMVGAVLPKEIIVLCRQAVEQSFAADGLESEPKCLCPADGLYPGCPVHGNHRR